MSHLNAFTSGWASPPGATISDLLATNAISREELARALGKPVSIVAALLVGDLEVTADLANTLAQFLGGSSRFWLTRERQYRDALARLNARPTTPEAWLRTLPIKEMISWGWVPNEQQPDRLAAATLDFFGCPSILEWHEEYARVVGEAVFKASPSFRSHGGALAAWLRRGEREALQRRCDSWDRERLADTLPALRALTQLHRPESFLPRLQEECARCGVAVVIARAPTGCRASGATRFLSPTKALLLLSVRHLSDDQFWFAFFHEVAHLLLHDLDSIFVEDGRAHSEMTEPEKDLEAEADRFAARTLIPDSELSAMLALPPTTRAIVSFARRIGVAPGIVVGQLQHRRHFSFAQMNALKRRYEWASEQ